MADHPYTETTVQLVIDAMDPAGIYLGMRDLAVKVLDALAEAGQLLPPPDDHSFTERSCHLEDGPHDGPHPRHTWRCSTPGCGGHACSGRPATPEET